MSIVLTQFFFHVYKNFLQRDGVEQILLKKWVISNRVKNWKSIKDYSLYIVYRYVGQNKSHQK